MNNNINNIPQIKGNSATALIIDGKYLK